MTGGLQTGDLDSHSGICSTSHGWSGENMVIKTVQKIFLKRFRFGRYLDSGILKYYRKMVLRSLNRNMLFHQ